MSQVKKSLPLKLGASLIGGATLLVCVGALTLPARAAEPKCDDENTIAECVVDPTLAQAVADGVQGVTAGNGDKTATVGRYRNKDGVKVNAANKGIADLRGLSTFSRIESLDLSGNPIDNNHASELKNLNDLKSLNLSKTHINNDLSQIGPKDRLENLLLNSDGQYRLSDISVIGSFGRLNHLELEDQKITDVTPLKGLSLLTTLDLQNNKIVDVSPLASLTKLKNLNVSWNQIRDIIPITGLTGLSRTGLNAENQNIVITPRHEYNKDTDWVLDGVRVSSRESGPVYASIGTPTLANPAADSSKVKVASDYSKVTWLAPAKYRQVGYTFSGTVTTNVGQQLGKFSGGVVQYASVVNRLSGNVRYDTMGAIVEEAYPDTADTVIVASGANFPDALAASGLAGKLNAPVVLTDSYSLSARADGQLARLHPTRVVVVGGPDAVSEGVVEQISKRVTAPREADVVRISGATRRDTANEIFAQAPKLHAKNAPDQNWTTDTAIIATGDNFADALSISSVAKQQKYPVFLSSQDGLDASTVKAIRDYGFKNVIIAGGAQAVPQTVLNQLQTAGVNGSNIHRIGGATRYQTSLQIAQYQKEFYGAQLNRPVFATGTNFPDALAGGVLAGKMNTPILLVSPDTSVNKDALNWIKSTGAFDPDSDFAYVLGGIDAVSEEVSDQISSILSGD